MNDHKHLASGWSIDSALPYHFEHVPMARAESMREAALDDIYVVESVNWTLADETTVHHNKYFAMGLPSAVALAARIGLESSEVAEDLTGLRPATDAETDLFWRVYEHYHHEPPALSDEEAKSLLSEMGMPFADRAKKAASAAASGGGPAEQKTA